MHHSHLFHYRWRLHVGLALPYIKSNIRGKSNITASLATLDWRGLVDDLAAASTLEQVDSTLAEIKRRSTPLHTYIVEASDYVQWVAYFTPLTFNLGHTTSNPVEQENWRLLALGIRSTSHKGHTARRWLAPAGGVYIAAVLSINYYTF